MFGRAAAPPWRSSLACSRSRTRRLLGLAAVLSTTLCALGAKPATAAPQVTVQATKTIRWTFKGTPAATDSGNVRQTAHAVAKDRHVNDDNYRNEAKNWSIPTGLPLWTMNVIAGGAGEPFANAIAKASCDPPVVQGSSTNVFGSIFTDVYTQLADGAGHGTQTARAATFGRLRIKSGITTGLEVKQPGKKTVVKNLIDVDKHEVAQSGLAKSTAKYNDPVTLVLINLAGDTLAVEDLFRFSVTAWQNATMAWDDTVGIVLDVPLDGSSASLQGAFPSAWVTVSPGPFSARLSGGVFTTTGAMTGLPWNLTYSGTDVIRAQLPTVFAPAISIDYEIPAAMLDDTAHYHQELIIDDEAEAEQTAGPPSLTIDGSLEEACVAPLALQTSQTGFGDNSQAVPDFANGSELNSACAFFRSDTLYLFFAGNLESNFNKLDVFFDAIGGGQNRLRGDNPNVDFNGLNRMGDDGSGNGLKFDPGFSADRYLTLSGGNDGNGYHLFGNFAQLPTGGGGVGTYLGSTTAASDGALVGGTSDLGIRATIDNSNIAGVGGGDCLPGGPGSVTTGIELAVPLAALGSPTGCIKIVAFVNGSSHDFVSNQVLGPLPSGACNLGEPRFVDFGLHSGNQYFELCVPPPVGVESEATPRAGKIVAWPNPFRQSVRLSLGLSHASRVDVFDVAGRHVRSLPVGDMVSGSLSWDGRRDDGVEAEPGLYFVRARNDQTQTHGIVLRMR